MKVKTSREGKRKRNFVEREEPATSMTLPPVEADENDQVAV